MRFDQLTGRGTLSGDCPLDQISFCRTIHTNNAPNKGFSPSTIPEHPGMDAHIIEQTPILVRNCDNSVSQRENPASAGQAKAGLERDLFGY